MRAQRCAIPGCLAWVEYFYYYKKARARALPFLGWGWAGLGLYGTRFSWLIGLLLVRVQGLWRQSDRKACHIPRQVYFPISWVDTVQQAVIQSARGVAGNPEVPTVSEA